MRCSSSGEVGLLQCGDCRLRVMERRTRRNHFSSAALSITDDLLHRNILLLRALALFGRRPPERVVGIVVAGVRKPAQQQTILVYLIAQTLKSQLVGWTSFGFLFI